MPQEQIARRIGIRSLKTLRKHFRAELDGGTLDANTSVAQAALQDGQVRTTSHRHYVLAKVPAGWKEHPSFESMQGARPPFIVAKEEGVQQP